MTHVNTIKETKCMSRPAKAIIHLDALKHNFHVVSHLVDSRIVGVVKSNAYGHGAIRVAQALEKEGIDALAVACIEEAIDLRENGIKVPIILLEGCFESHELPLVEEYKLITLLQNSEQVDMLLTYKAQQPLDIWMKIDSGMHRLGFSPNVFLREYARVKNHALINKIVLATHFSCADNPENPYTLSQITRFKQIINGLNEPVSLSSSAAILHNYNTQDDWVRPGIMLTGVSPFANRPDLQSQLKPVMELTASIIAIKELPEGCPVGYGNTYITQAPTRIGIVAIGYGDGYPQHLPTGTPVLVNNVKAHTLGRVSMDTIGIDLTHIPNVNIGTPVTLWGPNLLVSQVAGYANTIPYALLTGLQRVKRKYLG